MEITVLGAGVSGLTTAIRLLESGFEVTILTKEMSPNTAVSYTHLTLPTKA